MESYSDCLFGSGLFHRISLRFIHVVACVRITSLLKADSLLKAVVMIDHILSIHSFIGGHLDCFHLFTIISYAAMNMGEQISV